MHVQILCILRKYQLIPVEILHRNFEKSGKAFWWFWYIAITMGAIRALSSFLLGWRGAHGYCYIFITKVPCFSHFVLVCICLELELRDSVNWLYFEKIIKAFYNCIELNNVDNSNVFNCKCKTGKTRTHSICNGTAGPGHSVRNTKIGAGHSDQVH